MKKLIYILLGLCLLMVACSPEVVQKKTEQNLAPESSDEIIITSSGSTIEIQFSMNSYAVRYGYLLNNSDNAEPEDITQDLSYSDGWCSFEIQASGLPATGSITIYGQKGNDTQWTELLTGEYVLSLAEIAPDAYFSRRDNNSAEITISPVTDFASLQYKIEVYDTSGSFISGDEINGGIIELDNGKYSISLSNANAYTLKISQKLLDSTDSYSPSTEILIPTYDGIDSSIDIATNNNAFYISNIADDISSIELFKAENDSYDTTSTSYGSFPVQNGTATIPFEDKLKSLETGYFYITNENNTIRSNIINVTVPLMINTQTPTYKGLILEFEPDENISNLELRVVGAAGATAEINEAGNIFISGLDSNTEYSDLKLRVANSEYSINPTPIENFKTKSFAGTYEWTGDLKAPLFGDDKNDTNFCIVVEETNNDSNFPYYVYFDDKDDIIKETKQIGKKIRIMPLVDTSIGEPATPEGKGVNCTSPGDLTVQNNAYLTNASKWNAMKSANTIAWYVYNPDRNPQKDIVTTITWSASDILGGDPSEDLSTTTTFAFIEADTDKDGILEPFVKFENTGKGMVSLGLYTNGTIRNDVEPERNYTNEKLKSIWYLEKVN